MSAPSILEVTRPKKYGEMNPMEFILKLLQFGVMGFCVVSIIYSSYVVKAEQKREGEARDNIINFASNILKFSLGFALIIGVVQVVETRGSGELAIETQGPEISDVAPSNAVSPIESAVVVLSPSWSSTPTHYPVMSDFESRVGGGLFSQRTNAFDTTIANTINACGADTNVSYPLSFPKQPWGASDSLVIDNSLGDQGVRFELKRQVKENNIFKDEFSEIDVSSGQVVEVPLLSTYQIALYPVRCI